MVLPGLIEKLLDQDLTHSNHWSSEAEPRRDPLAPKPPAGLRARDRARVENSVLFRASYVSGTSLVVAAKQPTGAE